MQSKGWIWQACLLLMVSLTISSVSPVSSSFGQTETEQEEQVEPKSNDDKDESPNQLSEEEESPKADDSDDSAEGEQQHKKNESDDEDTQDDESADSEDEPTKTGSELVSEAFELKLNARTTSDLDKIVSLCEAALKKGLDESETEQASFLASESLLRFAEGMAKRVFATPQDRRWQVYRTQAMPRLRKAVKLNESNVAAYMLLAKFEAMDPNTKADALKTIEKAIELSADDRGQLSDALVVRARLKTDKEARLADLNQAIKHNPANIQAHELRAWALLSDDKVSEAMKDFEYWFQAQPKNFAARVIVAERLRASGQLSDDDVQEKVLGMLSEASEIDPKSGIPDTLKAQIYLEQKEYEKSIEAATKSIELDKRRPGAYQIRAAVLVEQGDLDAALKDANRLIKLDLMAGYQLRSQIFIQQAEYAKAIEDIQAMSVARPNNEGLQQQLAVLYNLDLRPEESIKIYNGLLRNNLLPDKNEQPASVRRVIMAKRADLLSRRGNARLSTGEHSRAASDYDESLKLFDALVALLPKDVKSKPNRDSGLLNNFAWLLATSPEDDVRDGERAIELATEAAEITEFKQAHILSTLASGYAETGDFESAIEWINKGLKVNQEAGAQDDANEAGIKRQEKSLRAELKSYEDEKPWRERQDPEEDRKKAKSEKEAKLKKETQDDEEADHDDDSSSEADNDSEDDNQDEDGDEDEGDEGDTL